LFFNCVSESQARAFDDLPNLLGVVQNGIPLERFSFQDTALFGAQNCRDWKPARNQGGDASSKYVLWLGRICEEKGPHLAIAAARHADIPLVIAGQVYPFRYHQDYFEREIKPYLSGSADGEVRFVESPHFNDKLELLRKARAVLLTSTAEETSSLVAMEAMACETPVVAFRRGAFPEIVADGVTGFVVDTIEEMAAALRRVDQISPQSCRQRVKEHFTADRMRREYEALYRLVLREAGEQAVA
jgi:glycosyltransferase involved in cell wall biosynthesis